MKHQNFLIFLLTAEIRSFLFQYIRNTTDNFDELNQYYRCLNKTAHLILESRQKEAIVCTLGETCILKSYSCQKPFEFYRNLKYRWVKREPESILVKEINSNTNFYVDPQTNDLKIKSIEKQNEGLYVEVIYERTLLKEYHLTVLNSPIRIPVIENYTLSDNKLRWYNQTEKLHKKNIEMFIAWTQWSDCACIPPSKNASNASYRIRYGNCNLRLINQSKSLTLSKELKQIHNLILNYNGVLPCDSDLIPLAFQKNIDKKNFIMYGDCFSQDCKDKKDSEEFTQILKLDQPEERSVNFDKDKIQNMKNKLDLADVVLILGNLSKKVVIPCLIPKQLDDYYLKSDMNIYWKIETSDTQLNISTSGNYSRIFIDELFSLNINVVQYSDTGIYTCYCNDEIQKVFLLKINYAIIEELFDFLNYFGVFLFLITLLLVALLSFAK